jgi:beta-phosphoglucomutase
MGTNNHYQAVLFDFDGVLVDSEPIHYECWREVLLPLGINLDWAHYHSHFIGISDRKMAAELATMAVPPISADVIYAQYPRKTALFRERMNDRLPIAPGVVDLLRSLDGYRVGVVSSSIRAEVEPVLEKGGLLVYLQVTICGEDVSKLKPDPEPYRKAAASLNVERVLVVEDSEAGEASGRAAGFDVLRVPHPEQTAALVRSHLSL